MTPDRARTILRAEVPKEKLPLLTLAYVAFTVIGCGYVLVAVLMGHGDAPGDAGHGAADAHGHAGESGADGHGHAGDAQGHASGGVHHGHDPTSYGVEGSGHGSATSLGDAGHAAFHFPFFSPLALATLCGAIGAYGLIALHGLGVSETVSLALAVPAAAVTAYAVTYVGFRLMSGSRGSSQIRLSDFQGATAEVITPIPAGGVGEIAAMVNSQRFTGPAREADGCYVPRGAHVKVRAMVGTTFVVYK